MIDFMKFMQGAFMMQMQFTQAMFMLPMYMMQNFLDMMSEGGQTEPEETGNPHENAGFKAGDMPIPPEMLQQLMSMDMSPENLAKLQKGLDLVFGMMPEKKKDEEEDNE